MRTNTNSASRGSAWSFRSGAYLVLVAAHVLTASACSRPAPVRECVYENTGTTLSSNCSGANQSSAAAEALNWETIKMIRESVFNSAVAVSTSESSNGSLTREVNVPREVEQEYDKQGHEVIRELLWIGKYGRPADALKALVYAGALVLGRSSPSVLTMASDSDVPELIDANRPSGTTDRQRLIETIERNLAK